MGQKTEELATRAIKIRYATTPTQIIVDFSGERVDNLTMTPQHAVEMAKHLLIAVHTRDPNDVGGFKEWLEKTFQVS